MQGRADQVDVLFPPLVYHRNALRDTAIALQFSLLDATGWQVSHRSVPVHVPAISRPACLSAPPPDNLMSTCFERTGGTDSCGAELPHDPANDYEGPSRLPGHAMSSPTASLRGRRHDLIADLGALRATECCATSGSAYFAID